MTRVSYAIAVEALKAGDRIMVTNPDPMRAGDIRRYQLARSGRSLTAATFAKLEERIAPVGDGLFANEPSQTYVWRNEA